MHILRTLKLASLVSSGYSFTGVRRPYILISDHLSLSTHDPLRPFSPNLRFELAHGYLEHRANSQAATTSTGKQSLEVCVLGQTCTYPYSSSVTNYCPGKQVKTNCGITQCRGTVAVPLRSGH